MLIHSSTENAKMEAKLKEIGVTKFEYKLVKPRTYHVSITAPKSVNNSDIAIVIYMNRLFGTITVGKHKEVITGITGKPVGICFDRYN